MSGDSVRVVFSFQSSVFRSLSGLLLAIGLDLATGDTFQAAADRRALELLRGIRFEPAKRTRFDRPDQPGALEWGGALFHWRTVAPPKPSSAPAPPSS